MSTKTITKVLIANRGEIAVRIVRAAADAGLASVAVYAEPDADSLFVQLADEAFALGGNTPAESYLDIDKILAAAQRSGADAVHPGYGFLAENAEFAQRVIDAGLTWIGPPPEAIFALGDKVTARHIASKVGAPLVPGTTEPVAGADEVLAFAHEHGLPVAIKAAHGGGGRGLKVARTLDEIPELFESATREAVTAFGRGECFVERYLDRPRHVETQCLADAHGHVVVVSTRDCSLQRRHQKVVEEAPAPFLTDEQVATLYSSSKAILREAGYVGAGTCEFLVGRDGTISFLEVNTRLQVEHPVSEQVTRVDLVTEQFRIADGEPLGYDDPVIVGHSFEFRINAEDPSRQFMPAPGVLTRWQPPNGPGVRVDEGYHQGMTVPGAFDSLVCKLVITGTSREQALMRSRRALRELVLEGMPTLVPFHRAVLDEPAFAAPDGVFGVHTRWIETEFDQTQLEKNQLDHGTPTGTDDFTDPSSANPGDPPTPEQRRTIVVEVNQRRLEVTLPADLGNSSRQPASRRSSRRAGSRSSTPKAATEQTVTAPMQGTIVKTAVAEGDRVEVGDLVVVLEAMKMENPVTAHRVGIVGNLSVSAGQTVTAGQTLCEIVDDQA